MNADEITVRAWRDYVYSVPTTDGNWRHCVEFWMQPENVRWLKDQMGIP